MLYAGIAWTAAEYRVAVLDDRGEAVRPTVSFSAGQMSAIVGYLRELEGHEGGPLVCLIEPTNGTIDGWLVAAGLRVHRADRAMPPTRPSLGSRDARDIALAGVRRLAEMTRLDLEGGMMSGRGEDWLRHSQACVQGISDLTAAGRCLREGNPADGDKVVALTFDDGPQPPYTGRILDVLDQYGITATFFCVGMNASVHTEELSRMQAAGHDIGNHSWSHPFVPDLSTAELSEQIARTDDAIEATTAMRSTLFRPPYGAHDQKLVDLMNATPDGPTLTFWNADASDWSMPGARAIATTLLEKIRPGSIALLHDGGGDRSQTAEALPLVIEGLLARDYRFVKVPALIKTA